jgi:hypothetical protein
MFLSVAPLVACGGHCRLAAAAEAVVDARPVRSSEAGLTEKLLIDYC